MDILPVFVIFVSDNVNTHFDRIVPFDIRALIVGMLGKIRITKGSKRIYLHKHQFFYQRDWIPVLINVGLK